MIDNKERMAPCLIRQREDDDNQGLYEIFTQPLCRYAMLAEPFTSVAHFRSWIESAGPHKLDIVATREGRVAGFAGLFLQNGRRGHVASLSIFVHDGFHNLGIGTMMMNALIVAAELRTSIDRIELATLASNQRAISMYLKFGFEIEGRHRAFMRRDGEDVDVVTMARLRSRPRSPR